MQKEIAKAMITISEALKGNVYTARQFRQYFDNQAGMGSEASIQKRIEFLMSKG
ncbi:hypothetical protein HUT03_05435 [Candidatus Liberibacter africanus]|uniref:hypothetical protein n=1 Tax=Liberibacter africanus TaxID=34020 RepID=UPI00130E0679|nr:hypothetical protein [Candidatus Liberibacter africanus]QTP64349.1 hypothetical protein HUT03_05435 [Candidatus Liberibacter africanus]